MNQMDDKQRYHPYYPGKNSHGRQYDPNLNQHYEHHYQYSSVVAAAAAAATPYDNRSNMKQHINLSNQHLQYNQYRQPMSKTSGCFPAPVPQPSMSTSTLLTNVPHERQSWIRSVKKTKMNESMEQKTQYLETMIRMPQQQKSSMDSSTFDRIRFAEDQTSITTNSLENNRSLDQNSFHLINNIDNYDDICAIEKVLFNDESQSTTNKNSNQTSLSPSIVNCEPTHVESLPCSGFLIDNCDEEELPALSPPLHSSILHRSTTEQLIQQTQEDVNKQRTVLVSELDAAAPEKRKELHRQKRLRRKLARKQKFSKQITESETISSVDHNKLPELVSDGMIEYNTIEIDPVSQLTNMVKKTSTMSMTDENKIAQMNVILNKIKEQQLELRKLRKYIMSSLSVEQKRALTNTSEQSTPTNSDLLLTFLNQPTLSGCWLCSGRSYTEQGTQCNIVDK